MEEKIGVIKEKFAKAAIEQLNEIIQLYKEDSRASVQKEIEKANKKIEALKKELMIKRLYLQMSIPRVNIRKELSTSFR